MRFISRFYRILERKEYLEKWATSPNTMWWGPQRHGAQCSCIGLRPALCRIPLCASAHGVKSDISVDPGLPESTPAGLCVFFGSGVKRNFWPLRNFWPGILSQSFCLSEQENKVWQLLFLCVLCKIKRFG